MITVVNMSALKPTFYQSFWDQRQWSQHRTWDDIPTSPYDLCLAFLLSPLLFILRILYEAIVGGYITKKMHNECYSRVIYLQLSGEFIDNDYLPHLLSCFYRLTSYIALTVYGFTVLFDKPWATDVKYAFIDYPFHPLDTTLSWYFTVQCAFYMSSMYMMVFDIQCIDTYRISMMNLTTLIGIILSYSINILRCGTLMLFLHDLNNSLMEMSWILKFWGKHQNACKAMLIVFFVSWVATRLICFPLFVGYTILSMIPALSQTQYQLWNPFQQPYAPRLILAMLAGLMFVHVYWTFYIFKVVFKAYNKSAESDARWLFVASDFDESEESSKTK
ncbi:unnamed protein product [Bursaphelenchus okinawaensis]|uniref:TLC domain-containing protein n=1 Tax=Bursaphelenchus okinawaensis TaxID=465554 RepID=A0A811KTY7_9BILA|nr:unnamed protein product [Bursaphelenchus okinawaensis]CAG9110053.1 unnamed protein product [Bursaphelenchus okinawaensis]